MKLKTFNTWLNEDAQGLEPDEAYRLINLGLEVPDHYVVWHPDFPSEDDFRKSRHPQVGELQIVSAENRATTDRLTILANHGSYYIKLGSPFYKYFAGEISETELKKWVWELMPEIASARLKEAEFVIGPVTKRLNWIKNAETSEWEPVAYKTTRDY